MSSTPSDTLPRTSSQAGTVEGQYRLPLHGLAALRIFLILAIGLGYASTMGVGMDAPELGRHWGYDPSWFGVQMLFILSGFLAMRSMSQGRTIGVFALSRIKSLWPALIGATLISVLIIYPIMCAPDAPVQMGAGDLTLYFLKTIFLIDPGQLMPGLMDDALYMCLLQGAIWTLRWGLILHIGFLLGWTLQIFRNRKLTFALCIAVIALHIGVVDQAIKNESFKELVEPIFPGIRLGYAYLIGVTLYSWQGHLRLNKRRVLISSSAIALLATINYHLLPWTAAQEILGVAVWLTLGLGFLHNAPKALAACPRLAPLLYVSIWPAAQIIVALNPSLGMYGGVALSILTACAAALALYALLRQARIQPARL